MEGRVPLKLWGLVRLSIEKENRVTGELELHEVMYMPGMRTNIFSLHRIRKKGA